MVNRVFVLGLDGATFDLLKPWAAEGKLPTFAALLERGAHGELESVIPNISAPAWASFATGKNPGKHGIFSFTKRQTGSYDIQFVTGADRKARAFWEILSELGKSVIIINVPMTYPPRPVNGIVVSGLDAPGLDCEFTYPPQVKREILRLAPDYKISMHLGGTLTDKEKRTQALQTLLYDIDTRARVAHHLASNYPWDVFVVKFNNPDIVQHHFWRFMDKEHPSWNESEARQFGDAIFKVYQKLDEVTASFLDVYEKEATFLIVSDHGAGMRVPKAIYVNEWLRSKGLLEWDHTGRNARAIAKSAWRWLMEVSLPLLLRYLSPRMKDRIRKLAPAIVGKAASYVKFSRIRWDATRAYVAEFPGIRLNVKGRDPQGVVEPQDYEALRDEIIQGLRALREPDTGLPLFNIVQKREEVYKGPYLQEAPDILLLSEGGKYAVS